MANNIQNLLQKPIPQDNEFMVDLNESDSDEDVDPLVANITIRPDPTIKIDRSKFLAKPKLNNPPAIRADILRLNKPLIVDESAQQGQQQIQRQQQRQGLEEEDDQPEFNIQDVPEDEPIMVLDLPVATKKKPRATKTNRPPKKGTLKMGIAQLNPFQYRDIGRTQLKTRLPAQKEMMVIAPTYYMNNRKLFIQLTNKLFDSHKQNLLDETKNITCENMNGDSFSLLTHQKIVRDYMNLFTPYRGLLLYHGLGSGKTCSSIAIAEGMKSGKNVIIMTPAALQSNYREQLKKCGDVMYKKQQFWEWISVIDRPYLVETLSSILNLKIEFITKYGGAWMVDISKPANYNNLMKFNGEIEENVDDNQLILDIQLDEMINAKYEFINYNGLRNHQYTAKRKDGNIFNGKVVIIDEAHNLISRIVNQVNKNKKKTNINTTSRVTDSLSVRIYKDLMSAENVKIVLLTGTPIINYPNEIAILFNILRGFIKTFHFTLNSAKPVDLNTLRQIFLNNNMIDYIHYNSNQRTLTVTKNPFGFASILNDSTKYNGVKKLENERHSQSDPQFLENIKTILQNASITIGGEVTTELFTALPDNLSEFNSEFIESTQNNVYNFKNPLKFKHRIMGLTSYFRSAQEELLPRYEKSTNFHVVNVPMSDHQFHLYENERAEERKQEGKTKVKKQTNINGIFEEPSSTFKIYSRLACNFVMPAGMIRVKPPRKVDKEVCETKCDEPLIGEDEAITDANADLRNIDELEGDELAEKEGGIEYQHQLKAMCQQIASRGSMYLSKAGLELNSPKFLAMLNNIESPEHVGLHLVYSSFRSVEGIELFSKALNQNGFSQFKIKKVGGEWTLNMDPAKLGTPCYALYTGTEDTVEREILRNIYNGTWKDVPKSLTDIILPISRDNNMGKLIKVLMITAAGSEGINLLNTRYVHIMEPYWHPVRIEQVIGRARRICSHQSLPVELQTVEVFLYLMTLTQGQYLSDAAISLRKQDISKRTYYNEVTKKNEPVYQTSDELLYEISCVKEDLSVQLLKSIKEASIDCATHIKSSGKEQLSCLTFGNLSDSNEEYTYNPNINLDQGDAAILQNTEMNETKFKVFTHPTRPGVKYVIQMDTSQIFSFDSYNRALAVKDIRELEVVGEVNNEKIIFYS